jgi:hypothetical protein
MEVTTPPFPPDSKIKIQKTLLSNWESPPLTPTPHHFCFSSFSSPLSMAGGTHRSRLPFLLLILSFLSLFLLYSNFHSPLLLTSPPEFITESSRHRFTPLLPFSPPLSSRHILFGIASSSRTILHRIPFISLWWDPSVRLFVFVDSPYHTLARRRIAENQFPFPVLVSANVSHFPYTFKKGLRSGIRVARIIKELIERPDISKKEVIFLFCF